MSSPSASIMTTWFTTRLARSPSRGPASSPRCGSSRPALLPAEERAQRPAAYHAIDTRTLLEKLARSVRVVAEEPTPGRHQRPRRTEFRARQRAIDIFSCLAIPLSRNLIIARTIHVCSDYPNTTKDALALWNSALRSTSTDGDFRLLVNHQVFRFVEDDDEDPNYHCDNAEITSPEMGIDSIAIRSVDKASTRCSQLGCGGVEPGRRSPCMVACWVGVQQRQAVLHLRRTPIDLRL